MTKSISRDMDMISLASVRFVSPTIAFKLGGASEPVLRAINVGLAIRSLRELGGGAKWTGKPAALAGPPFLDNHLT